VNELPAEIFSLVLQFLSPRQILALASCSSVIMQYVNYELVIRNTVLTGGSQPVLNLTAALQGLCRQAIYTPSPMRLLRIVNARRCERCSRKTNILRMGLFICSKCANDLTYRERKCRTFDAFIQDDRVDKHNGTKVLKAPFLKWGGTPVGPIVTSTDIKELIEQDSNSLDDFLNERQPQDRALVHTVQEVYELADADRQIINANQSIRRETKERAKVRKIINAIDQIKAILQCEETVMEYSVSTDGAHCCLLYGVTNELMKDVMNAPSRLTKTKLQQIAASIDAAYPFVMKHGLHDFSCLSVHDPLQASIRHYVEQEYVAGMDFLRDRAFSGAVKSIQERGDAISPVLKRAFTWTYGVIPVALRNLIAQLLCDQGAGNLHVVISICDSINTESTSTADEWLLCQRMYTLARHECKLLQPKIKAYRRSKQVCHFLGMREPALLLSASNMQNVWMKAKKSVLTKVILSPMEYERVRSLLMERDWDSLRDYHASKLWLECKQITRGRS
jgi:hypothetical protein